MVEKYSVVVLGTGPIPCNLMIVGEAPGREEIKQGEPFVGRSGMLLDDALHKAGTHRTCVYITNVFKGDVGEGNRNPTRKEIEEHLPLLQKELYHVWPDRILLLGRVPSEIFIIKFTKMAEWVGKGGSELVDRYNPGPGQIIETKPISYISCYHPAYVLRGHKPDIVFSFYSVIENFVKGS